MIKIKPSSSVLVEVDKFPVGRGSLLFKDCLGQFSGIGQTEIVQPLSSLDSAKNSTVEVRSIIREQVFLRSGNNKLGSPNPWFLTELKPKTTLRFKFFLTKTLAFNFLHGTKLSNVPPVLLRPSQHTPSFVEDMVLCKNDGSYSAESGLVSSEKTGILKGAGKDKCHSKLITMFRWHFIFLNPQSFKLEQVYY